MCLCGGFRQLRDPIIILHVFVAAMVMVREEGQLGRTLFSRCLEVVVLRGSKRRPALAAALLLELEPSLALEDVANLV